MNKNIEEELMKLASSEQQWVAPERDRRVEKLEMSDKTLKLAMKFAKAMNSVEWWDFKDIELALNKVFAVWEMNILKDYDWVLSKYWPGFIKPTVLERIEKSIQNKKPWQVILSQWEDNLIFLPDGVLYFVWVKKYPEAMISQVLTLWLGNIRYVADNIERDANFDETTGLGLDV